MSGKVLVLPGDGIGVEVVPVAVKVMRKVANDAGIKLDFDEGLVGGVAIDQHGTSLPDITLNSAKTADVVLFGGVGGPKWDHLPMAERPERGLLRLRAELGLFANLRPAILFAPLAAASSLKPELVADLDVLILRELTGGIYFGEPRGVREENGEKVGFNTDIYREHEIVRIARVAFQLAEKRGRRVCSVDKANVLEVTQFWRDVVTRIHQTEFPHIELSHLYVDNAGMQLVRAPKQFDVIVTGNMFGDILSDIAAMLTGSLGMLPSASLGSTGKGLYEPVHGTAPDIAGRNFANPLATILSVAMAFRYTLNAGACADRIEKAVARVLADGVRTRDIAGDLTSVVGTVEMGEAVMAAL